MFSIALDIVKNVILFIICMFVVLLSAIRFGEAQDMRGAKVGAQETYIEYERLPDGDMWEFSITCTKISQSTTQCVYNDDLGWVETLRCRNEECKVISKR